MQGDFPRSTLIVQTAFIGDVVLVVPLIESVKRRWPECDMDVLVRPPGNNLLETHPAIRNVIVYDKLGAHRGTGALLRFSRLLRRKQYDLALVPHRSFRSGFLVYSAAIPGRIGFNRGGGRFFHTKAVPYPRRVHEIERNLALLSPFGSMPPPDSFDIPPSEDDLHVADRFLEKSRSVTLIALAPGSVWFTKRWPEEHFIELAEKCIEARYEILLLGDSQDRDLCNRIAAGLGGRCHNTAGETTLRQSVELLRRCALLVTNDSAPTHLGTAAGIRVLTLFGSTIPEFGFAPYGVKGKALGIELDCRPCTDHGRRSCPKKHFRCLTDLAPSRVFDEIEAIFSESSA